MLHQFKIEAMIIFEKYLFYFLGVGLFLGFVRTGNTVEDPPEIQHIVIDLCSNVMPLIRLGKSKHINETGERSIILSEQDKRVYKIIKPNGCSDRAENSTKKQTAVVEVVTARLNGAHRIEENATSVPIETIRDMCNNETNCTVERITFEIKDITVNISHISHLTALAPSDVIVLEYLANGEEVKKLKGNEKVSINFPNKLKSFTRKQVNCLFLKGVQWSTEGMKVGSIDGENIQCLTNHLSTFTMVVLQSEVPASTKDALNIISYIGSGLSLAGLSFSCLVYIVLHKDLQILRTSRYLVHFNLQIALGLTQIAFLAGGSYTHNKIACTAVAMLVHYFSLAGFTWIFLEALMLYFKLISVYAGEFVRIRNFLFFGWGFPLLLVGISAAVKIDAYGNEQWCWLSYEDGFEWVFFAPVIVITSVTFVTVIAVIRVVLVVSKLEGADAKKRIILGARGVVILFPTLGLSWGFSVIAVNQDELVWKYLFAIFTTLQGFIIFLVYGICNRKIRTTVARKIAQHTAGNPGFTLLWKN